MLPPEGHAHELKVFIIKCVDTGRSERDRMAPIAMKVLVVKYWQSPNIITIRVPVYND
jgi:hypothetical protein